MTIQQARCLLYGQVFRKCSASKLCRRPAGANNLINELEATYIFKSGRRRTFGKQMIFWFPFSSIGKRKVKELQFNEVGSIPAFIWVITLWRGTGGGPIRCTCHAAPLPTKIRSAVATCFAA
jgi:hypothetical protein